MEMTNSVSEFERLSCAECVGGWVSDVVRRNGEGSATYGPVRCKACGGTCEESDQQLRERVLKRLEEIKREASVRVLSESTPRGPVGPIQKLFEEDDSTSPWGPACEEYGADLSRLIPITDTDFGRVAELLGEAVSELLDCEAPGVAIEVKGKTIAVSFSVTPWRGRTLEGTFSVKP